MGEITSEVGVGPWISKAPPPLLHLPSTQVPPTLQPSNILTKDLIPPPTRPYFPMASSTPSVGWNDDPVPLGYATTQILIVRC